MILLRELRADMRHHGQDCVLVAVGRRLLGLFADCPRCEGTGWKPCVPCRACKATGIIPNKAATAYLSQEDAEILWKAAPLLISGLFGTRLDEKSLPLAVPGLTDKERADFLKAVDR